MRFERTVELAKATPTGVLCEVWGATAAEVNSRKSGEQIMTISEAGALADLHGMKLPDILSV